MNLSAIPTVALVGNPNCGKTALFNALTGSRQKVANYAGVTVEKKEGLAELPDGRRLRIVDLPGTYSLRARSPDEAVTRDAVLGRLPGEPAPDVILCVADATNLGLVLRLALELKTTGHRDRRRRPVPGAWSPCDGHGRYASAGLGHPPRDRRRTGGRHIRPGS